MKELSIEEKAKAYDEAVEKAKMSYHTGDYDKDALEMLEIIFPELKESEDERIIGVFREFAENFLFWGKYELTKEKALAWFEKQIEKGTNGNEREIPNSEQKPAEYTLEQAAGIFLDALSNTPYNNKPITDAQVVTKELLKFLSDARSYNPNAINEQKPADNKGMNLVEEKMTPFQKKVFCIIDTTIEEEQGLKQVCDELLTLASNEIKQKPAWSEEDDYAFDRLFYLLDNEQGNYSRLSSEFQEIEEIKNKLKSLKERCTWKPSDEQMIALRQVISGCSYDIEPLVEIEEQLKKLMGE